MNELFSVDVAKAKLEMTNYVHKWVWRLTYLTIGLSIVNFALVLGVRSAEMREAKNEPQWLIVDLGNDNEARVRLPAKPSVRHAINLLEAVEKNISQISEPPVLH